MCDEYECCPSLYLFSEIKANSASSSVRTPPVCLSGCLVVPTSPAVRPRASNGEPGLWPPYQRFKNQRESDKTDRQQCELRNTPPACPVPVSTTAAAPITFRKTFRLMCLDYRLCSRSYFFCGFHILADHKVGFNLMHRSTFLDSIFL